ncbi:MAG: hypothetical protein AAF489_03600 [Bacteroidota bacterium]
MDFVESILLEHNIRPFGTVGRYDAAPLNIAEHMRENIQKADFVVIVATPRYVQRDVKSGRKTYGLSEMVHVEAGMAYMSGKPVVVFVLDGTDVGNFLPSVTQYIVLNGQDHGEKWPLIKSLLNNAFNIAMRKKEPGAKEITLGGFLKGALAIYGGIKLFQYFTSGDDDEYYYE